MFIRIINRSIPIIGICKSYSKITYQLQNNVQLDLRYVPNNRRYAKVSCPLFFSQQYPKEKHAEPGDETQNDKNNKSQKDCNQKNAEQSNQSHHKSQEKTSERNTERSDDKDSYQSGRSSMFGKEMILHSFANSRKKERETFLECLRRYESQPGRKLDRVAFIYTALKHMEEFGVHLDLSVYKILLDIFPKEKMIPTNLFQTLFMHYPKEQYCAVALLEQMEDNGIIPDPETELILLNVFGRHGMPLEKYWKMMYWMPKFKNLNPWPVPKPLPNDILEVAKLAMIKISSIDVRSTITIFDTNDIQDSIDKTWIVSAMAPKQSELLLNHDKKTPIYVEGPFKIYVATKSLDYFTLRANPPKDRKYPDYDADDVDQLRNPYLETKTVDVILPPSIHEEDDATIFANCATGTSSKDSLLSWIRCLEKDNPVLAEIPIVFTLRNYAQEKLYLENSTDKQVSNAESNKDNDDKFLQ